ncbi:MAG: hypothetical protein FKGGLIKP_00100 [Sodalis sp. Fse]|nr:MAG: hypothetical protein FKGGLIKP_00100 [Sodalis sp. Fse]
MLPRVDGFHNINVLSCLSMQNIESWQLYKGEVLIIKKWKRRQISTNKQPVTQNIDYQLQYKKQYGSKRKFLIRKLKEAKLINTQKSLGNCMVL